MKLRLLRRAVLMIARRHGLESSDPFRYIFRLANGGFNQHHALDLHPTSGGAAALERKTESTALPLKKYQGGHP